MDDLLHKAIQVEQQLKRKGVAKRKQDDDDGVLPFCSKWFYKCFGFIVLIFYICCCVSSHDHISTCMLLFKVVFSLRMKMFLLTLFTQFFCKAFGVDNPCPFMLLCFLSMLVFCFLRFLHDACDEVELWC